MTCQLAALHFLGGAPVGFAECLVETNGGGVPLEITGFVRSVELLAWARANKCRWDGRVCQAAASGRHLEVLQYAREKLHDNCPWDCQTTAGAAAGGHLQVLRWAREHGCPLSGTCEAAAAGGQLDVLKWAREHGCPWGPMTCARAAAGGHLEVLRWAREHDCPWDTLTCDFAATHRHLDV